MKHLFIIIVISLFTLLGCNNNENIEYDTSKESFIEQIELKGIKVGFNNDIKMIDKTTVAGIEGSITSDELSDGRTCQVFFHPSNQADCPFNEDVRDAINKKYSIQLSQPPGSKYEYEQVYYDVKGEYIWIVANGGGGGLCMFSIGRSDLMDINKTEKINRISKDF